jgi:carbamoylphosphate synthase large subunit
MIFNNKRRNGEAAVAQLEVEHATAQAKRTKLRDQLAAAEAALNDAVAARRASLLGDDVVVGDSHDIVVKGTDRDSIADAVEQIEVKVAHLESRIIQERSKAERETLAIPISRRFRREIGQANYVTD